MGRVRHLRVLAPGVTVLPLRFNCHLCGRKMKETEAFFHVVLQVTSGVNRSLEPLSPLDEKDQIETLLNHIAERDSASLEDEVHLERKFRVCPLCRLRVLEQLHCR